MITSQTITALLGDQIPDYVQEYYPMFVIFITKYYEWLEQGGNPQSIIQNIRLNSDIDTTLSSLTTRFLNMYAPDLPVSSAADRNVLIKYIRQFYQKKGSEDSFKFFFRAFFNDSVTIFYPNTVLFKPSDNTWYVEKTLTVSALSGNVGSSIHTTITGSSSGAYAVVNVATQQINSNSWELVLQPSSISGTFQTGETITATAWNWTDRTSSQLTMTAVRGVDTRDGVFKNTHSMLSADQVIQDSYYFQQFSYVLRSRIGRDVWGRSILQELHQVGNIMFNDMLLDAIVAVNTSSFLQTLKLETSVKIPTIKSFIIAPGYSFDRLADFNTGTSATTSAGTVVYDPTYIYKGEKVTWALMRSGDEATYGFETTIAIPGGPTFDKDRPGIGLRQQIIGAGNGLDFTKTVLRYRNTSSMSLTAGTTIASFTTSITTVSSLLLLTTWVKDIVNNAANEAANVLYVTIRGVGYASSTSSLVSANGILAQINTSDEIQRNYLAVAVGDSQLYPKLTYYNSSNTVVPVSSSLFKIGSSIVTTQTFTFRPYNANRAQSFSRFSALMLASPRVTGETLTITVAVSSDSIFAATSSDLLTVVTVGR